MSSEEMLNWAEVYRRNYKSSAFSYINWFRSAESLVAVAREIEPRIAEQWESYRLHSINSSFRILADHFQRPYFMLMAYAIENLFKGQLVKLRSEEFKLEFSSDPRLPKILKTHNLLNLARETGFTLLISDEDLLRRLTRCSTWAGRYPVPLLYHEHSGIETFSHGLKRIVSWFGEHDISTIHGLIVRIRSQFDMELRIFDPSDES